MKQWKWEFKRKYKYMYSFKEMFIASFNVNAQPDFCNKIVSY